MEAITTVFQFEIRYNHILNFSQISRKILSPYVRLAKSIKVENQNTIEERIIFNFGEEDYLIIVGWDRVLIKGQGNLSKYKTKNSSMETPFFSMLNQIKELDEFGSINNVLLAVNYVKNLQIKKEDLINQFIEKTITTNVSTILDENSDIAITIENKEDGEEESVSFGPYFGSDELLRRPLLPINIDKLEDTEFLGVMAEYKYVKFTKAVSFNDFVEMANKSEKTIERIWKMM